MTGTPKRKCCRGYLLSGWLLASTCCPTDCLVTTADTFRCFCNNKHEKWWNFLLLPAAAHVVDVSGGLRVHRSRFLKDNRISFQRNGEARRATHDGSSSLITFRILAFNRLICDRPFGLIILSWPLGFGKWLPVFIYFHNWKSPNLTNVKWYEVVDRWL